MGDQGDRAAEYAARRAQIERAFTSLPPAGSQAYWDALTAAPTGAANVAGAHNSQSIPLEVLARCWRERISADRSQEADRVFGIIADRISHHLDLWANKIAGQTSGGRSSGLAEELEQECYLKTLESLRNEKSFLFESFMTALNRIEQHIAHAVMEREGQWQRTGVKRPRRAPARQTDSLDAAETPATPAPRQAFVADPAAEANLKGVEALADLDAALRALTTEQRALFYMRFQEGLTQREIADELGVTDRTVRHKLTDALNTLRALLADPDGAPRDPQGERKDNHDD